MIWTWCLGIWLEQTSNMRSRLLDCFLGFKNGRLSRRRPRRLMRGCVTRAGLREPHGTAGCEKKIASRYCQMEPPNYPFQKLLCPKYAEDWPRKSSRFSRMFETVTMGILASILSISVRSCNKINFEHVAKFQESISWRKNSNLIKLSRVFSEVVLKFQKMEEFWNDVRTIFR